MYKDTLRCVFCEEHGVVRNGQLASGGQRFKCKTCDKQFHIGGTRQSYTPEFKEKVVEDYLHAKTSARTVAKKYAIATSTLLSWSKKHKQQCLQCKKQEQ